MGEVIYVDFKARKRLPVADIMSRRLAKTAAQGSMDLQPVPPIGGTARYNRGTEAPSRETLLEDAVQAIIAVENIDEESLHMTPTDGDETSPYKRLDDSLAALTPEDRDMVWDEAHRRLDIDPIEPIA